MAGGEACERDDGIYDDGTYDIYMMMNVLTTVGHALRK